MIKKIIKVSVLVVMLSCSNSAVDENSKLQNISNENANQTDTAKHTDVSDSIASPERILFKQIDQNALFLATGTEPGWILTLFQNKFQLIANYGKDTIEKNMNLDFKKNPIQYQSADVSFVIDKKPCIAISGDTLQYSVKLKFQNKDYSGCGKFLK